MAFHGTDLIARGTPRDVVLAAHRCVADGATERIAVFDDDTGAALHIVLEGSETEVLAALADHPLVTGPAAPPPAKRGRGRPRLEVVSREVSLFPRHWEWLASQPGSASATLRRLVDQAARASTAADARRRAVNAAHTFLWDMAGNLPAFEEASRALFAGDFDEFRRRSEGWPTAIRELALRFLDRAGTDQPEEAGGGAVR